jgi:F-type H+-transporting ATPase subunit epsilon
MKSFLLKISSPEGDIFNGEVTKISVRGTEGELAVMAGHIPFVTSLVNSDCYIWTDEDTKKKAHTDGGLLTVETDSATLISGSFEFDE